MYKKIGELKLKNKDLKIMLAVGGWNHGSLLFSNMASNERNRKNFVSKAVIFLRTHHFDGLGIFFRHKLKHVYSNYNILTFKIDLDWEYPASR